MSFRYQELSTFKIPVNFRGRGATYVQLWWLIQSTLFAMSPQFAYGWRRFLLRCFGAKIGKGVIIRPSVRTTYPWKLNIGDNSWVGDHVELYTLGEITIGNNAVVSQKSYLCTGSHDFKKDSFDIYAKPIVIEDEAWVATDVFISPGVTVGKGAVIGARSSVFKDMPPGMICTGYPAKPVKPR
ncbi:putative colanic acid biosynthesis acetyltransferase [Marinobacterium sp. xm-d-564]|uniref:putative colanic acid biosynthesis acetyltransferase n=1 Tax=Marinobacterium sp. xm-d-564 TaxID=2497742 RepID=UPI001568A8B7|nr:putative colanic acid biosynthesis acetyltransferase [Marinobacterium sp. xm-d-564]NRP59901.1 Galactoside O-acetyltransferase [Marinobacterium sp. xm-d-564]